MDIDELYNDPSIPGSFGGLDKAYREFKKLIPGLTRKDILEWSKSSLAYSLHKPSRIRFKRQRIYTNDIDYLWECDLVDMSHIKKENNNTTFLLTCIDTFSKYAWVKPLKRKTGKETIAAFKLILKEGRKPRKLRSDKGSEFVNKDFQELLKDEKIHFYTANNEPKAAIVERFNRTLKNRMYRYFTAKNTLKYIDNLQDFVNSYNNTYHRSIGMRPTSVTRNNVEIVKRKLFKNEMKGENVIMTKKKVRRRKKGKVEERKKKKVEERKKRKPLKVGDYVRLSLKKRMFKKGYLQNYTEEIFKIRKTFDEKQLLVYEVEDLNNDPVIGRFYREELQLVYLPKTFVVEEILEKKKKKGKNRYLIRWRGYPPQFDEWVDESQLVAI